MRSIQYPNELADLVVLGFKGSGRAGFSVRPLRAGIFRLVVWPDGSPDPDHFAHALIELNSRHGPPSRVTLDLRSSDAPYSPNWRWALVPTSEGTTPLEDLTKAAFGADVVAGGRFPVSGAPGAKRVRCAAWSCHMPYETENKTQAVLHEDAEAILKWYAEEVEAFEPHVIWGAGDTSYSDGTEATDFSSQVYDKGSWYANPENRAWLRQEYRNMYRHFWSFKAMRTTMSRYPHLFIWDDHEIHDGWGSEGGDFSRGNLEMFRIAREVAEEYILAVGPRVRPTGREAHQAYVLGPLAAFIFDTRSARNYESPDDRLISSRQFRDFTDFLAAIKRRGETTDLVMNTTVPLVGLRDWVTSFVTKLPDFANSVIQGMRDDVRDSWTSPGNKETLTSLLKELRDFMNARPNVRVTNVSGDIHVANAFEILIPGASRPLLQLTSSAITNRHHPPAAIAAIVDIGDSEDLPGVGLVRRLWPTITDPNFLTIECGGGQAKFTLKVWDPVNPGAKDLEIKL